MTTVQSIHSLDALFCHPSASSKQPPSPSPSPPLPSSSQQSSHLRHRKSKQANYYAILSDDSADKQQLDDNNNYFTTTTTTMTTTKPIIPTVNIPLRTLSNFDPTYPPSSPNSPNNHSNNNNNNNNNDRINTMSRTPSLHDFKSSSSSSQLRNRFPSSLVKSSSSTSLSSLSSSSTTTTNTPQSSSSLFFNSPAQPNSPFTPIHTNNNNNNQTNHRIPMIPSLNHLHFPLKSPRRFSTSSDGTNTKHNVIDAATTASEKQQQHFHARRFNQYTFHGSRITKGDHFLTGHEDVSVCVDLTRRRLEISLPRMHNHGSSSNNKRMVNHRESLNLTSWANAAWNSIASSNSASSTNTEENPGSAVRQTPRRMMRNDVGLASFKEKMQQHDSGENKDDNNENNNYEDMDQKDNTIVIDWDNISGLDFQYAPCAPVVIVFELFKPPETCPSKFSSVVYFLYCTKQDCATYLDELMLKSDERLYKLSIQSLPTWSVVVNRYSIPVYYSYRVRQLITTIVNFYILFSLLWGFYDLYKNLPYVGGAMRRIFGPLLTWFEPIWRNRVILLFPLILNRLFLTLSNFLYVFSPMISVMVTIGSYLKSIVVSPVVTVAYHIGHLLYYVVYPIIVVLQWLHSGVWGFITLIFDVVRPLFLLLFTTISAIAQLVKFVSMGVYTLIKLPIQLVVMVYELLGVFVSTLYNAIGGQLEALSFILCSLVEIVKAPFLYTGQLFNKRNTEAVRMVSEAVTSMSSAAPNSIPHSNLKEYFDQVKESLKPVSYIWTGIRRIIDSFLYTYNTKIKHHSLWMKRLLVGFLLLAIISVLLLIFMLVL